MNNKGFVFIETIVTIVVLTTTLILLYASYSNVIIGEKRRLYFDDITYVYKTLNIKKILDLSLDRSKFSSEIEKSEANMYMYVFNIESPIYIDNMLISESQKQYHFIRLIYINKDNISNIKDCIGGNNTTKCKNTMNFIEGYADAHFREYLLTIDKKDITTDSILISLIYETKAGGTKIDGGKYEECLQQKIFTHYGASTVSQKKQAVNNYYKDDSVNFDMQCENAYYISWVNL